MATNKQIEKKAEIYLPFFSWFYGSIHNTQYNDLENNEYENIIEDITNTNNTIFSDEDFKKVIDSKWKDFEFFYEIWYKYYEVDYKDFKKDYSKEYVSVFYNKYKNIFEKIWISEMTFISLYSPKYYNYWNDEITVKIKYNFNKIKKYLEETKKEFSKYIKEKNAIRSWFYPSEYMKEDFDEYMDGDWNWFVENQLTQIIEFTIINETEKTKNDIDVNIYNDIDVNIHDYIKVIKSKTNEE